MVFPSKKRSRSSSDKHNAHSNLKRLKRTSSGSQKTKLPGKNVRLDDLAWKKVSMPDRLDDVEGFFGLEEVDDVDVVREEGVVKFVKLGENETSTKEEKEDDEIDGGEDAEEWGGIESSDEGTTNEPDIVEDDRSPSPALVPRKSALKQSNNTLPINDPELSSLSFSILSEETPEEDIALPEWASLNLSPPTIRALARLKFTTPTPIQSAAIPLILSSHSLIGKASTGSGKTLAFGIPILERYLDSLPSECRSREGLSSKDRKLTALIIAPTRELAHQITKHFSELCYYTDLKIVTITGGLSIQKQQRLLDNGVDVIVATPGRLWEIVSEGQGWVKKLQNVKMLVLDEADRVLEEGHFKEVEQILALMDAETGESSDEASDEEDAKQKLFGGDVEKNTRRKREKQREKKFAQNGHRNRKTSRQTLVFSATFHKGLQQKLAGKNSKRSWADGDLLSDQESMEYLLKKLKFQEKPEWVDVDPVRTVAEKVKEAIVECGNMEKDLFLYYLLLRYPSRTLIFTNSITSVRRLVPLLNNLLSYSSNQSSKNSNAPARVFPLHSQLPQKSRLRSLERFSEPLPKNPHPNYQPPILVATDVAARGLDIPQVSMVVHYHLPRTADMYVHRSGRTGRASSITDSDGFGSSVILCAPGEAAAMARLVGKVHATTSSATIKGSALQSLDVDRQLVAHLKKRVDLAKKIADAEIDRQKIGKEEDWLRTAAEDLGVDVSDSEIAALSGRAKRDKSKNKGKSKAGRGSEWDDGREEGDDVGGAKSHGANKGEIEKWKWELKNELTKKINKGFSMKYLTSGIGGVNLAEYLLSGGGHGEILGEEKREVVQELMR